MGPCADDTKPAGSRRLLKAFQVCVALEDFYFSAGKECAPGSIQPTIYVKGFAEINMFRP
jgi:hypothetical protein